MLNTEPYIELLKGFAYFPDVKTEAQGRDFTGNPTSRTGTSQTMPRFPVQGLPTQLTCSEGWSSPAAPPAICGLVATAKTEPGRD